MMRHNLGHSNGGQPILQDLLKVRVAEGEAFDPP